MSAAAHDSPHVCDTWQFKSSDDLRPHCLLEDTKCAVLAMARGGNQLNVWISFGVGF